MAGEEGAAGGADPGAAAAGFSVRQGKKAKRAKASFHPAFSRFLAIRSLSSVYLCCTYLPCLSIPVQRLQLPSIKLSHSKFSVKIDFGKFTATKI
jgi:hypothetical protein